MQLSRDMIEINRDKKKITITNNRELYRAIKSGAAVSLFPLWDTLESLQAAAESVDPALGWFIEMLTQVLTATYLYYRPEWTLTHAVALKGIATDSATATANITVE